MSIRMNTPPRILIVGGGIAGLMLATQLGNRLGRSGSADISLIDRSATHVWKPMLHTIAAGTWDVHQQQLSYIAHARAHHFTYQPGHMGALDRDARHVVLDPITGPAGEVLVEQRALPYDVLVLSIGSRANDFGVPGVAQHCHFIDSQAQAEAFNLTLRGRLLRSWCATRACAWPSWAPAPPGSSCRPSCAACSTRPRATATRPSASGCNCR
jgi:NADH dehydrogenase